MTTVLRYNAAAAMLCTKSPAPLPHLIRCVIVLLSALTSPALAQTGPGVPQGLATAIPAGALTRDGSGAVVVRATRITQPLDIDGRLDDAEYSVVPAVTGFVQQEPRYGTPVSEKTEVWVMFDDRQMYFACRCWDEHPERIVANDMRRDSSNLRLNDSFTVQLDTFHDRRDGYAFGITPIGGVWDTVMSEIRSPMLDWNAIWQGRAERFDGGWTAEIAIPFKSLRYHPGRQQTWGLQMRRVIPGKNETAFLSPVSPSWGPNALANVSASATLIGVEAPPATRNLEVKPYAISRVTTDLQSRPAVRNDIDRDAGIDVKYGITKNLTTDFTYNTDFAQVEADEAQVNLTRFSLSFPEKRDFFLEGQGNFGFGATGGLPGASVADAPTIFYSRRIGLSGSAVVPIVGGARLTGKAGAWSLAALSIETDKHAAAAAAQTNFTVLRLQRDVLRRSTIGGIFTRRSVSTVAPGANDVWGVDANFSLRQNVFVTGYLARSRTQGRSENDLSYRTRFNYNSDRYGLGLDRLVVEPNFNPEVGFLRREDFRRSLLLGRFSPRPERNRFVRKFSSEGSLEYITDNQNRLESRELRGEFRMDLHSSDTVSFQYLGLYEFLPAPFLISDGVCIPVGGYDFDTVRASFTAGQQHRVSGSAAVEIGTFYDGEKTTTTFRGRVEVTPRLGIEPNISLNWIDLPQGRFATSVMGARTTFTMTPRMFVAALLQYSSGNTSLSTNLRFRWEYQPGSEVFVVYTEGRDTFPPRGTALETRGFVVKINRLFRF